MKNVIITIKGVQNYHDSGDDVIELVTDGEYSYGKKGAMFTYEESPITGLDGTKTTFIIRDDSVTMKRSGTLTTNMIFEEGKKHHFLYEMPFGATSMAIDTQMIRSELSEAGGELEIYYTTDIDHSPVGKNQFFINIREQNAKGETKWQI